MKNLIACLIIACSVIGSSVFADPYIKIGAGYKIHQTEWVTDNDTGARRNLDFNDPFSARIEIGIEHDRISYGISHHSNWLTGFPFNDKGEMTKTELFVDYKFTFGQ